MLHVVVAYDVVDDNRRARLAKFLSGYLDRVQKSVFEGVLEERRFLEMKAGIAERVDQTLDAVRIFELCRRCVETVEVIGLGIYVGEPDEDVIF
jgi:CRISPR-associated protein Cas2